MAWQPPAREAFGTQALGTMSRVENRATFDGWTTASKHTDR
jgi:hypothetical protein